MYLLQSVARGYTNEDEDDADDGKCDLDETGEISPRYPALSWLVLVSAEARGIGE